MTVAAPKTAMVLAAGLGKRMLPITATMPKPLVEIAGRSLLDRGLDCLAEAGVETAVVNVHYFPERIVAHTARRRKPKVVISDESDALLDSAGGIVKALPLLGPAPFFIVNADTFWIDGDQPNLERLALAWDERRLDIVLMLARLDQTTGHGGGADFARDENGRLTRARGAPDGFVYAGAAIVHPRIFAGLPTEKASLNPYFDAAIAAGRMIGVVMEGHWITVGTPDAIATAEAAVAAHSPRGR